MLVSRHAQTQFLYCFESTLATDQNIKNKTFAKCTRKPLLGDLFAADRIFYGQPRPEDIQYCIVGTYFSFLDFVIRDLSVILESSFDCISDNGL